MRRVNVILLGIVVALGSLHATNCSAQQPGSSLNFQSEPDELFPPETSRETIAETDILHKPIDLAASTKKEATGTASAANRKNRKSGPSIPQVVLGLAFVLCLIWVIAVWAKKFFPNAGGGLPPEALQVLGQRPIGQRQMVQLIRCGSRILIVGSTAQGLTTLSEITDPVEVDYLAGLCQQQQPNSVTSAFSQLFQNYRESLSDSESTASPLRTMTEKLGWSRSETAEAPESSERQTFAAENSLKERLGRIHADAPASSNAEDQQHG